MQVNNTPTNSILEQVDITRYAIIKKSKHRDGTVVGVIGLELERGLALW